MTLHVSLRLMLVGLAPMLVFGDAIDFENQCPSGPQAVGPCSSFFSTVGNATNLSISTSIGTVDFTGGAVFDDTSNLPANETVIYGTAGNASNIGVNPDGTGFTNPLTITFPTAIHNFFLDVLNGNTESVTYQLADNAGNSATFTLAPNLSSGHETIGFAAAGTMVTVEATTGQSTPSGMTWDYFVDNVHFDEPLPGVPEPVMWPIIGLGMVALTLYRHHRSRSNNE